MCVFVLCVEKFRRKVDVAQSIYSAISDECQKQMPNFAKSYREQNSNKFHRIFHSLIYFFIERLQKLPANSLCFHCTCK